MTGHVGWERWKRIIVVANVRVKRQRVWPQDDDGGILAFSSPLEDENQCDECGERGESDDTSDDTCHKTIKC
jgi:hypothetical protein